MAGALIPYGMQAGRALAPMAGRALSPVEELLQKLLGGPGGRALMEHGIPGMSRAVPGAQALPGGMSPAQLGGAGAAAVGGGAMIGMMPPDTAPQSNPLFDEISRRGQYDNTQPGVTYQPGPGGGTGGNPYGDLSGVPMNGYGSEGEGVPVMQESPEVVPPQRRSNPTTEDMARAKPEMDKMVARRSGPSAEDMARAKTEMDKFAARKKPAAKADYQSNNQAVSQDGQVNWSDPDNAADFFRADQEMRRIRGLLG